ncbi:hypothetical protein Droror1_Dr00011680 [Drosera rotundifolia]
MWRAIDSRRNPNFPATATPEYLPRRRRVPPLVDHRPPNPLLMGQVRILKRGEQLNHVTPPTTTAEMMMKGKEEEESEFDCCCVTEWIGPEPELVEREVRVPEKDWYAGAVGLVEAPAPSEVPLPWRLVRRGS